MFVQSSQERDFVVDESDVDATESRCSDANLEEVFAARHVDGALRPPVAVGRVARQPEAAMRELQQRVAACARGAPFHVVARHVGRQRRRGHRRAAAACQDLRRQPPAARRVALDDSAQREVALGGVLAAQRARQRGVGAAELDRALAQKSADVRHLQHARRGVRGEAEDPQRRGCVAERMRVRSKVNHSAA